MIRKGGLPPRPLPARSRHLVSSALILLATLLATAGVVYATPGTAPPSAPACVPAPRA